MNFKPSGQPNVSRSPSEMENRDSARHRIAASYQDVRRLTQTLCEPLGDEDFVVQSMPDASPAKWHLAHTTWFFEQFVLRDVGGYRVFDEAYGYLFNSYYNSVGPMHPRPRRGLLTRPPVGDVLRYRAHVDEHV